MNALRRQRLRGIAGRPARIGRMHRTRGDNKPVAATAYGEGTGGTIVEETPCMPEYAAPPLSMPA